MTEHRKQSLQTKWLLVEYDHIAPDGSEIRLLVDVSGGGMCHCTLPRSGVSKPVAHRSVEELWYFVSGRGEVWRKLADSEEVVEVGPDCSLNIPRGASFQFRNTGDEPLCFNIATIPPWPGEHEAVPKPGYWEVG